MRPEVQLLKQISCISCKALAQSNKSGHFSPSAPSAPDFAARYLKMQAPGFKVCALFHRDRGMALAESALVPPVYAAGGCFIVS